MANLFLGARLLLLSLLLLLLSLLLLLLKKDLFLSCSERGTKEKSLGPHEESNVRPLDARYDALPISYRDSTANYNDHPLRGHAHHKRLRSAKSVTRVDGIGEMFELGNE